MVRTVKLETSGSGSYFNLGLGQVDSIDFIVATEDFEENKISIFPNPSQGQFQIELESNNLSNTVLQIHDVKGQLVYNSQLETNNRTAQVNLQSLPSGIYMLSLKGADINHFEKLIIE